MDVNETNAYMEVNNKKGGITLRQAKLRIFFCGFVIIQGFIDMLLMGTTWPKR